MILNNRHHFIFISFRNYTSRVTKQKFIIFVENLCLEGLTELKCSDFNLSFKK